MEKLIPTLYKNYGVYVNTNKMIPNVDGTIPVWKRVLLGVHSMAKTDFKKTAAVLGYIMQHWHPHSEASGPAETLVQNGFILGQGQWGNKIGVDETGAAASRYTEMKADPLIEEMAFKYIKYVKWESDELDPEPVYLPTMIPLVLFAKWGLSNIGFGLKTVFPTYKLRDLIIRQVSIRVGKPVVISPNIVGCDIKSGKDVLEQLLTTGTAQIQVKGKLKKDPSNFRIYVKGWDPTRGFATVYDKINKGGLLSNGDIAYIDESSDDTCIRFEVNRARNRPDIYEKMEKAIDDALSSTIHYKMYVVDPNDPGRVKEMGVDEMLAISHTRYKAAMLAGMKDEEAGYISDIAEMDIIEKIKKYLPKVLTLPVDQAVDELVLKTKCDKVAITGVIDKYKIRKLLTVSTDTADTQKKLTDVRSRIVNINSECDNAYKELAKKV